MTAPLDSSQGVTMHRRRGLEYRESQPSGFGSAMWAGNVIAQPGRLGCESGPIHQKLKPGGCSKCQRRPGIRSKRSIARPCARGDGISVIPHLLPRSGSPSSPCSRSWSGRDISCPSASTHSACPASSGSSSCSSTRSTCPAGSSPCSSAASSSSLFNRDLPQRQYQASRLSSRALEGSPCYQARLQLLTIGSYRLMPPAHTHPDGESFQEECYRTVHHMGELPPLFMLRIQLTTRFDGTQDLLLALLVQVNAHMLHTGRCSSRIRQGGGKTARLRQIRQGSQSVSEYISEICQLAWVVQDWLKQVKIHFFREGLHPEAGTPAVAGRTLDIS
uniref:Uncharacterized protein n=1 Tax=Sphaerodactylus townsendi TaxID=933632 RepID=A0ACB8F1W0_9SAUR